MPRIFVQQDGDAVYRPATLEMRLDLLGGSTVVNVADEDAPGINVLPVLPQVLLLLVERGLHLAQLGGLGLHLRDPLLHRRDFFLRTGEIELAWTKIPREKK